MSLQALHDRVTELENAVFGTPEERRKKEAYKTPEGKAAYDKAEAEKEAAKAAK